MGMTSWEEGGTRRFTAVVLVSGISGRHKANAKITCKAGTSVRDRGRNGCTAILQ